MSRFKAALSLYIALAVHLLLILLLALAVGGRGDQALRGSGSGFGGEDRVAQPVEAQALSPLAQQSKAAADKKPSALTDSLTLAATAIDLSPPKPKPKAPRIDKPAPPPAMPAPETRTAIVASDAPVGSGAVGGGSGGYVAQVRAQLSRNRRSLPGILSTAHSEVAFNIGADGAVSEVKLVTSSGIAELDREATALVLRAAPFPAPPDGKARRLSVPVSVEPPRL